MRLQALRPGVAAALTTVALLSAFMMPIAPLRAQATGATDVTLFTEQNFGGQAQSWTLPPDKPYLLVPDLGPTLRGDVGSARVGAQVGIALFQKPFFESNDNRCGPEIGSSTYPDLWWTGLTATFEPAFSAGNSASQNAAFESQDYGSMILFRRDLGPPPGLLLMERSSYTNWACGSPLLSSYHNRLFLPIPEAPESGRCYNLETGLLTEDSQTLQLNFKRSDRVYFMLPEMVNEGFNSQRHRLRATLFDAPNCAGEHVSFPRGRGNELFYLLSKNEYRNRARSVLVSYEGGSLANFLTEPAPQHPEMFELQQDMASQEIFTPSRRIRAPAPAPAPVSTPPAPAVPPAAETTDGALDAAQSAASASTPATAEPAPAAAEGTATPGPADTQVAATPAPRPLPNSEEFRYPVADVYRLNYCLNRGEDCGEPAATAFCQAQGFRAASDWSRDPNIGAIFPTIMLGANEVCAAFLCDGFKEITCAR